MYKYRRLFAVVTLFSFFTIVLLSVNFSIWGGCYSKGDIEYTVRQEMALIENTDPDNHQIADVIQIIKFLICLGIITQAGIFCTFSESAFCRQYQKNLVLLCNTLVRLSVRLDN